MDSGPPSSMRGSDSGTSGESDGSPGDASTDDAESGRPDASQPDGGSDYDAAGLDSGLADVAACGALGQPCCAAQTCNGSLICESGSCQSVPTTGEHCSSNSECSGRVCIPVGNSAGCTDGVFGCETACCLNVNVGGSVAGACEPDLCPLRLCATTEVTDPCPSPSMCEPFLNGTGICTGGPLPGGGGDGGAIGLPDFPGNVCSTACNGPTDCVAGWTCGALTGQTSSVCLCSASYEICDGRDNDCNGIVDDEPGADRWCSVMDGPGHVCEGGTCVCPGTC
jgi:hypothetical protein